MNHHIPVHHRPRLMLALLALLIMLGSAPFASRAAVRPAPQAIGPAAQITEAEPNNAYQNATPLAFRLAASSTVPALVLSCFTCSKSF